MHDKSSPKKQAADTDHTIHVTFFKDYAAERLTTDNLTLSQLCERVRNASSRKKADLPWLKLAQFGIKRSDNNSLRHDANVESICGIEIDYDEERITFDDVLSALQEISVSSLLYTSPSHTAGVPRWRVLAPTSKPLPPEMRAKLVARLNGCLKVKLGVDELAATESFTLSQAYYYGWVCDAPKPDHRAEVIHGDFIDERNDLVQYELAGGKKFNRAEHRPGKNPKARIALVAAAVAVLPNPNPSISPKDEWVQWWNHIGMAIWRATDGSEAGYEAFAAFSAKNKSKYNEADTRERWEHYAVSPPTELGFGTLDHLARAIDPHYRDSLELDEFVAFLPAHKYIFIPTRGMWPASSVNSQIAPIPKVDANGKPERDDKGKQKYIAANVWLDQNHPVEDMTWAPGEPELIKDKLINQGGWFDAPGRTIFNFYQPPTIVPREGDVSPWLNHIKMLYGATADHIVFWLAHRVQHPGDKINHSLVLGGAPGIGKDTILAPVRLGVGSWNFTEPSPKQAMNRFNKFNRSVIMRINEARDLGDVDRYAFYEHMKLIGAAPPETMIIDEKNIPEYYIPNVTGAIITTNYKTSGLYLPADDRRHHVNWSDAPEGSKTKECVELWKWYENGGYEMVAYYLNHLDLSKFDPKAPPPKTEAFWEIVNASRSEEDAELADVLDNMNWPKVVSLHQIRDAATGAFRDWLLERRNGRLIPHKLENCGYRTLRNPDDRTHGRWKIGETRQTFYVKRELSEAEGIKAVEELQRPRQQPLPMGEPVDL
jgi:hypothetical protein